MSDFDQRVYDISGTGSREEINELLRQSAEADKGCQSIHVYITYLGSLTREGDTSITAEIENKCGYDQDIKEASKIFRDAVLVRTEKTLGMDQLSALTRLLIPITQLDLIKIIDQALGEFASNPEYPNDPQALQNEVTMYSQLLSYAQPEGEVYDYLSRVINDIQAMLST